MSFRFPDRWTTSCADLLTGLNTHNVEYLLIGSMAKALHSVNGTTVDDMDVMVDATPDNARKVTLLFHKLGLQTDAATTERLAKRGQQVPLFEGSADVLTPPHGVFDFAEAAARRMEVLIPRIDIPIKLAALCDLDALDALREAAEKP